MTRQLNTFSQLLRTFRLAAPNRTLPLAFVLLLTLTLPAQDVLPIGFEQWTAKSLAPVIADLAVDAPNDPHRFAVRQLADYPNDGFLLVHRTADGAVEWHETQADVFFVQSGTATLLLGGKLINGETVGPHEKRNGSIVGGVRRKISPGDVVRIPPRVPHQVLLEGASAFDYFVVKVKGY
jgi:mannose-6-phosphate isomerase-like protein (cupin superfamily)